jgi:hypothetical protein
MQTETCRGRGGGAELFGKPRYKWEDNIKKCCKEIRRGLDFNKSGRGPVVDFSLVSQMPGISLPYAPWIWSHRGGWWRTLRTEIRCPHKSVSRRLMKFDLHSFHLKPDKHKLLQIWKYLLTPWSKVLLEKLTSLCS